MLGRSALGRRAFAGVVAGMPLLLAACGGAEVPPATEKRNPHEVRTEIPELKLLKARTADLKRTTFLAHPALPVPEGCNAVWCATWQLAWDAMRRDVAGGAEIQVTAPAPAEEVKLLNGSPFPEGDLAPASRVAMAGWVEKGIVSAIRAELARKFPEGTMDIEFPAAGLLAFGYLKKRVPFRIPFEPVRRDSRFLGREDQRCPLWFGMSPYSTNPRKSEILGQVRVLAEDDVGERAGGPRVTPEAFVLEIDSADGGDRLLLARQPSGDTLEARWSDVQARIARGKPHGLDSEDLLAIPKFHFSLRHDFREFLGATMTFPGFTGTITVARQALDFRLDESGAKAESYAMIGIGLPKSYVLDRPFLLALQEKGASRPYLLLWIANDELLAQAAD